MCKCLGIYGSFVSLSDLYLVLLVLCLYGWGMGHPFLHLLAFAGCDCLLPGLLLGDLLHVWLLRSLLGFLFMHLLSEEADLIYSLVHSV